LSKFSIGQIPTTTEIWLDGIQQWLPVFGDGRLLEREGWLRLPYGENDLRANNFLKFTKYFWLMLRLFGVKWFLENNFGILRCLVGAKIMVNENHFRFDRKTFFNFWKTIYNFKNRKSFSKIKLFVLAYTFDIRLPESGQIWPDPAIDPTESGQNGRDPAGFGWIRPLIQPDLTKMARIWQDLTGSGGVRQFWPDPAKRACRNPTTATGRCRIPTTVAFSPFVIFLWEPNAGKYFREFFFFWKWFRRKYFTTETILRQNKRSINRNHFTVDYYFCLYQTSKNVEIIFHKPFYVEANGALVLNSNLRRSILYLKIWGATFHPS
jgi:hypothetical protein